MSTPRVSTARVSTVEVRHVSALGKSSAARAQARAVGRQSKPYRPDCCDRDYIDLTEVSVRGIRLTGLHPMLRDSGVYNSNARSRSSYSQRGAGQVDVSCPASIQSDRGAVQSARPGERGQVGTSLGAELNACVVRLTDVESTVAQPGSASAPELPVLKVARSNRVGGTAQAESRSRGFVTRRKQARPHAALVLSAMGTAGRDRQQQSRSGETASHLVHTQEKPRSTRGTATDVRANRSDAEQTACWNGAQRGEPRPTPSHAGRFVEHGARHLLRNG